MCVCRREGVCSIIGGCDARLLPSLEGPIRLLGEDDWESHSTNRCVVSWCRWNLQAWKPRNALLWLSGFNIAL